jgi:SAM-dependent methyltransferase
MYTQLIKINNKPKPFEIYSAEVLWNTPHISRKMLAYHLDENVDLASRNKVFIEKSIEWITSHFSVGAGTRICDFGCGPGLYTLGLALRGASVTGLDFSQNSIEYAQKNAAGKSISINYVLDNYLRYDTDERFDLILMIMCDFCALSPEQRNMLLQKFHHLLKENGSLLLDVYSLKAFDKINEAASYEHRQLDGFWSEEDYYGFLNTMKYPDDKVTLDKYTIVEKHRSWQVYNWLQYFSLNSLAMELNSCGFYISENYSNVAGSPYSDNSDEFAVIVRRI